MKKLLLVAIFISMFFCFCAKDKNLEVYKGEEACLRFLNLRILPGLVTVDGNKAKFRLLDKLYQTKYECEFVVVDGKLLVEKSLFKKYKECDMEKEEADYLKIILAGGKSQEGGKIVQYTSANNEEVSEIYKTIAMTLFNKEK